MKRNEWVPNVAEAQEFSPAFSGGLIEASSSIGAMTPAPTFSPAFSGGLIEATALSSGINAAAAVFPRVQRGPH